jgi:starch phosphorylase
MWQPLCRETDEGENAIDQITNGIHVPTWVEPKMALLFNRYLGPDWLANHDDPAIWELIDDIPDEEFWETHCWLKNKLINAIREQARQRWVTEHVSPSLALAEGVMLNPTVLTIGFARRFATYKRADLILHDTKRLQTLLNDPWRPIQIVFAGKAHPADLPGIHVLQKVVQTGRDPGFGGHIAFVEDYGEQLAQYLVHGVDIWLNTPLPPMEACGTSGMKAALNGVPQLSIMDGWWPEGFNGRNGWAFGEKENAKERDAADAEAIYTLLEREIIPLYYRKGSDGIAHDWVRVMKEAVKSNGPRFSARRMVKEYVLRFYAQALKAAR